MVLVFLIGPPAVGKMAVGIELAQLTGLKLFLNHDTIEMCLKFFEWGTPGFNRLNEEFRTRIFEEVAASDLRGLIFTLVTALDEKNRFEEKQYLDNMSQIFLTQNHQVYYVELEATLEERLRRNKCESRINAKPSKQNIQLSEQRLLNYEKKYVLNSNAANPFHYSNNYLKIENSFLSALEVAQKITNHFDIN